MEKFELEGTAEGLQRPASKCDQAAQGLTHARVLNLQGWNFLILFSPERELIGILPHSLKNSNFQLYCFISTSAFYNFLALLEKKMKKVLIKAIMTPQISVKSLSIKYTSETPSLLISFQHAIMSVPYTDLCHSFHLFQMSDIALQGIRFIWFDRHW